MPTILITGASSGIGKATALRFQSEGWNVIATMRDPAAGAELAARDNVLVTRLDVTDGASIAAAVAEGLARCGRYLNFYNGRRPHSSLDGKTPDQAYFNQPTPVAGAA